VSALKYASLSKAIDHLRELDLSCSRFSTCRKTHSRL
jgi:hypothetical protein